MVLSGRENSSILKSLIAVLVFSLPALSIYDYKEIERLPDAEDEMYYAEKWEKHGAYYDKFEVIFSTFYSMKTAVTRIEFNMRIKILTTEGAEYGTIPIYRFSQRISYFDPHLYDPGGNEIELDTRKMKQTYLESEKVVFPNVTKGCTIELRMEFLHKPGYYYSWYQFFDNEIPVRIGRFVHVNSPSGKYKYKVYQSRYSFKEEVFNKGCTRTWTLYEYEPLPDIDYLDYRVNTEPRIMVMLTKVTSWNRTFNTRKKIFRMYKDDCFGILHDITGSDFLEAVKSCTHKVKDPLQRGQNILKWVQDNMSRSGKYTDRFANIMKTENASDLQICCLCKKMLEQAGIKSSVVITGDKNYYNIDPDFLIYSNYITTPLVVATIHKKKLYSVSITQRIRIR